MRILVFIAATLFALAFVYSFMPGLEKHLARWMLWGGQAGLLVCLVIILTVFAKKK